MNKKQKLFEEFYKYFILNPQNTYILFFHYFKSTCDNSVEYIVIERLRRNLQKQGILNCVRKYFGRGNITTVKTFDHIKAEEYKIYLSKKNK